MDPKAAVSGADRAAAVLQFDLGLVALREGDAPRALRKLLLAVLRDPLYRMAHVYLARVGRSTGSEHAEEHLDMAREIVERTFPKPCPVVSVTFVFDKGEVKDLKIDAGKASANDLDQRSAAAEAEDRDLRVVLFAEDHGLLDERWFEPVQTLYVDGPDEKGMDTHERVVKKTFEVSLSLLAPRPGARVAIYDAAGSA